MPNKDELKILKEKVSKLINAADQADTELANYGDSEMCTISYFASTYRQVQQVIQELRALVRE